MTANHTAPVIVYVQSQPTEGQRPHRHGQNQSRGQPSAPQGVSRKHLHIQNRQARQNQLSRRDQNNQQKGQGKTPGQQIQQTTTSSHEVSANIKRRLRQEAYKVVNIAGYRPNRDLATMPAEHLQWYATYLAKYREQKDPASNDNPASTREGGATADDGAGNHNETEGGVKLEKP